ncbi:MAG: hypothetical protein R3183_09030, partial [Oleiphilaceae bacterium]|nr:hypothetical protein [Oleiphilaceae bacterium]
RDNANLRTLIPAGSDLQEMHKVVGRRCVQKAADGFGSCRSSNPLSLALKSAARCIGGRRTYSSSNH